MFAPTTTCRRRLRRGFWRGICRDQRWMYRLYKGRQCREIGGE